MSLTILALSVLRSTVGITSLLLPTLASRIFYIPASTSGIMFRLFGSRDLVLGSYLFLARNGVSVEARRTALLLGMVVDGIDVLSTVVCMMQGELGWQAGVWVGAGALMFVAMGWWGLEG